jgi:putative flavoprotein involved in K+ transport
MGRFDQTIDSFPDRRWPRHTAVTGVNGGYDINVRQMAADGMQLLGRIVAAMTGTFVVATDANQTLDQADAAFVRFLESAHAFAAPNPHLDLGQEDATSPPAHPPRVTEVDSLDLRREGITSIIRSTSLSTWKHDSHPLRRLLCERCAVARDGDVRRRRGFR